MRCLGTVGEVRSEQTGAAEHRIALYERGGLSEFHCVTHRDRREDCEAACTCVADALEDAADGRTTPQCERTALTVGALPYVPRDSTAAVYLRSVGLWQALTPAELRAEYARMVTQP